MVQTLKTCLLAWALLAEVAAFIPSASKLSQRIDSSKWRLEQYDVPASYGGRIRSSNGTDSTFLVDTSSYHQTVAPAEREEPNAVVVSKWWRCSCSPSTTQPLTMPFLILTRLC